MTSPHEMVNVRYMVDDVQAAVDFYTGQLGFALRSTAAPAFADVSRGNRVHVVELFQPAASLA